MDHDTVYVSLNLYLLPIPMSRTAVGEEETLLADMSEEMQALTESITDIDRKSRHQYNTLLHVTVDHIVSSHCRPVGLFKVVTYRINTMYGEENISKFD